MPSFSRILVGLALTSLSVANAEPILIQPNQPEQFIKVMPESLLQFPNGKVEVQDAELTNGLRLMIPIPAKPAVSQSFEDITSDVLRANMPSVMAQLGVPADKVQGKVTQGIPLIQEALRAALNGQTPADGALAGRRSLFRRGFWDAVGDFLKDIGCSAFAAPATIGFLAYATAFSEMNSGRGRQISDHENFFVYPVHGDVATSAPVNIVYQAFRPLGFQSASITGTTFGRNIYTPYESLPWGSTANFNRNVNMLLHEITHVTQYRSPGFNTGAFGLKYMFDYCKAGFSYCGVPYEKSGYETEKFADDLIWQYPGRYFFDIWVARSLKPVTGFPTQRTHTQASTSPNIMQLGFQSGAMQVRQGPGICFCTFSAAEVAIQTAAKCLLKHNCDDLRKRDALPPVRDDGSTPRPEPVCKQAQVNAANSQCNSKKASWASLDSSRAWDCSTPTPVGQAGKGNPKCKV